MFRASPRPISRTTFVFLLLPLSGFASPSDTLLNSAHPSVRTVAAVQAEITGNWMRQSEVLGTAVGLDNNHRPVLAVYVDRDSARAAQVVRDLPAEIRGVAVQVRLTDRFQAMRRRHRHHRKRHGTFLSHRLFQQPPVQLGTSGGWAKDSNDRVCCGGTLGALVQIGGEQYILSNWHVLEDDMVPGTNDAVVTNGDPVIQPALIDLNCGPDGQRSVATLEKRDSLPNTNVDCAIAKVIPGMVRSDGAILEIGPISAQTVAAFIGQPVKKSGRTTRLTHNVIIGLNATVRVDYFEECGGELAFSKTFTGQIMVGSRRGSFLADGDSGALLVEDVATNPHPVGLLFAGSSTDAIANPIDEVLAFLGATMVGN